MLLHDVTVLEMASAISGPSAAGMLADLGATVVKVEPPGGDPFRAWEASSDKVRSSFAAFNRGKRSIVIDIKQPAGRKLYTRLAARSDVLIENFRPGRMEQLGLGWSQLSVLNPRLVYCQITGRGSTGPDAQKPTYDAVAQAVSGLLSQFTDLDKPEAVGPTLSDQLTAVFAVIGVLAALNERWTTGVGRLVEVDMLASSLALSATAVAGSTWSGSAVTKTSRARNSQSYAFVASDGLPFAVHLSTPQKFWVGLSEAVGRPELVGHPDFATKADRIRNYDLLRDTLDATFRTHPRSVWLERLEAADVPAAPILTIAEAIDTPQVKAKGIIDFDAEGASHGLVRSPVAIDGVHLASPLPPPKLGEHTDALLAELGLAPAEVDELRGSGAVG